MRREEHGTGLPDEELVEQVRSALAAAGDPELREHPPADRAAWEATVRELWDCAARRS